MTSLNLIVFLAFVLTGGLFIAGLLLDIGPFVPTAVFYGWFLCVYSSVAYIVASVHAVVERRQSMFWRSLYPVNFSMALLAYVSLGTKDLQTLAVLAAIGVVASLASYGAWVFKLHEFRASPIVPTLVLAVLLWESILPVWMWLSVGLAFALTTWSLLAGSVSATHASIFQTVR